jgi:hypothetical protein
MFVRFSAYADGTDMSEKWDAERNYMGIAFAAKSPTDKAKYQWISLADISLGRYAEEGSAERYLFYVGNGTDENNRSNALTLDEYGNVWFAGDLTFGKDSYSPKAAIEQAVTDLKKWIRPVSSGGTGGTTAEDARANLGINRDLFNVPEWNVDENVGIISPAASLEVKVEGKRSSKAYTASAEKSVSIPMINTGKLYLDIDGTWSTYGLLSNKYTINTSIETYVNGVSRFTENYTKNSGSIGYPLHHRINLEVNKGEDVTLVVRQTLDVQAGGSNTEIDKPIPYATFDISKMQLKANIATAHTYLTLGEDLESPTAEEILETLLGV